MTTIAIGDVLDGKYEITDILGEGAMGVVYLALHRRLQRTVALKTLRAEIAGDSQVVARFEREARAASAIGHENIVQIFDAGGGPVPYLVMENLRGESLGALLEREGPLAVDRAIGLCKQVLAGLEAAHQVGIIHRDLKPDNIFVCREGDAETVKILDFGISKILDKAGAALLGDAAATRAGMVMGTPLYMSPEQAHGRTDLDHRADLWSLVCVLYECVSGTPPFLGENYNQLLAAILLGRFTPLQELVPGISPALSSLVDRGLSPQPDDRFASASALREALDGVAQGDGASTSDAPMFAAAFDNLAEKFLAQDQASAPGAAEQAGSGPAVAAASPVSDARFAPPASLGSVDLALELDVSSSSRSAGREIAVSRAAPSRRGNSRIVTRAAPRRFGASLTRVVLFLLILAGAGVGYRYYSLGYVLAPERQPMASLNLELDPAATRVHLDGVLQSEPALILPTGEGLELRLSGERRMSYWQTISVEEGSRLTAKVRLGNQLPGVAAGQGMTFAMSPPPEQEVTTELLDAGIDKLRGYSACGPRLLEALAHAQTQVAPLPRALVDECVLALRVTAERQPPMPGLDDASLVLASAVGDLDKAARDVTTSKGAPRKLVRARQAAFEKASKQASTSSARWTGEESSTHARWLALELGLLQRSEPGGLHAHLREVAVRSDRLVRTHLSAGDTNALREELKLAHDRADRAASKTPEAYQASGGAAFLRAMKPVLEKDTADELLFWHNQAIEVFNQLVLPFDVVSAAESLSE